MILQRQVGHQARQPLAILHHNFLLSSVWCEYHCTVVMCFNTDCRLTFGFVLMQTKEQAALSTITDCYLLSSPPVCWLWGSVCWMTHLCIIVFSPNDQPTLLWGAKKLVLCCESWRQLFIAIVQLQNKPYTKPNLRRVALLRWKYTIRSIVCEAPCHQIIKSSGNKVIKSLGH